MSCHASSWVSAAAGNFLGVLDWFWVYKLAGHCTASGGGPLGQPSFFSALLPCQALDGPLA